jgi:hypothetical protein
MDEKNEKVEFFWLMCDITSYEIKTFLSEIPPQVPEYKDNFFIPFPKDLGSISSEFYTGKAIVPSNDGWQVVVNHDQGKTELFLRDRNNECERIPHMAFQYAVLHSDFLSYKSKVKSLLVQYNALCNITEGLKESLSESVISGFVTEEAGQEMYNELTGSVKKINYWIEKESKQNFRLNLAHKKLKEFSEKFHSVKNQYTKITRMVDWRYGHFIEWENECKRVFDELLKRSTPDEEALRDALKKINIVRNLLKQFSFTYSDNEVIKKKWNDQDARFAYDWALKKASYFQTEAERIGKIGGFV